MISAIIPAAGQGRRMNSKKAKQYLCLAGKPVLSHTLLTFVDHQNIDKIILVIPAGDFDYCQQQILAPFDLQTKITLIPGGKTRQDSVYNGIMALDSKTELVVIHDGVRPLIRNKEISLCIKQAAKTGACILGIPAFDTVKKITRIYDNIQTDNQAGEIQKTLVRDQIWLAQTPQVFARELIKKAHQLARQENFEGTDDAALVERMGFKVKIIAGHRLNIKITSPEDLALAKAVYDQMGDEIILSSKAASLPGS